MVWSSCITPLKEKVTCPVLLVTMNWICLSVLTVPVKGPFWGIPLKIVFSAMLPKEPVIFPCCCRMLVRDMFVVMPVGISRRVPIYCVAIFGDGTGTGVDVATGLGLAVEGGEASPRCGVDGGRVEIDGC